jgi:hypothetical protein
MKILTTILMTLLVTTSTYAACGSNGEGCSEEECKKLSGFTYSADTKKCNKSTQKSDTDCSSIVQSSGAKATDTASGAASTSTDTKTLAK